MPVAIADDRSESSEDAPMTRAEGERLVRLETKVDQLTRTVRELDAGARRLERIVIALAGGTGLVQAVQVLHLFGG